MVFEPDLILCTDLFGRVYKSLSFNYSAFPKQLILQVAPHMNVMWINPLTVRLHMIIGYLNKSQQFPLETSGTVY